MEISTTISVLLGSELLRGLHVAVIIFLFAATALLVARTIADPTPPSWLVTAAFAPAFVCLLAIIGLNMTGQSTSVQLGQSASQALADEGVELYNSTEVNKWVKDMVGSRDLLSSRSVQISVDGEPTEATLSVTLEIEGREGIATLRLHYLD